MRTDGAVTAQRGTSVEDPDSPDDPDSLTDSDDLAAAYDQHARDLHRYLARRAGAAAADDLVAEAFLVLWEQRDRFDPTRARLRAWLFGIATNLLRHHSRSEVRRLRAWARHGGARTTGAAGEELGARAAAKVDAEATSARLAGAIAALRVEERDVLLLVAWADLTPAEIAEVRGIPVGTVRTRLHRARTRLRGLELVEEKSDD